MHAITPEKQILIDFKSFQLKQLQQSHSRFCCLIKDVCEGEWHFETVFHGASYL